MLDLNLFGTGQLYYGDRALPGFPRQQPHLLLCYLALYAEQAHSREHLAAVFWGGSTTADSRKYLRNALWRLRQALQSIEAPDDDILCVADDTVSLCGREQMWIDTRAFEEQIMAYRQVPGSKLTTAQTVRLESALQLYKGDLLQGMYDDWCIYERERYQLLYLSTLGKLMDHYEVEGAYEHALGHGERILSFDNTRERTHRQMMRLYWLLGDRGAALAQYKRCAQILQESLHLPPMTQTRALYQKMIQGEFPTAVPESGSAACPTDQPAIGSDADRLDQALLQLQQIEESVEQARLELRQATSLIRALAGAGGYDQGGDLHRSTPSSYNKTLRLPS